MGQYTPCFYYFLEKEIEEGKRYAEQLTCPPHIPNKFTGGQQAYRLKLDLKKDKLVEISGGKLVVADVSTASAAIIKANDGRGVAEISA